MDISGDKFDHTTRLNTPVPSLCIKNKCSKLVNKGRETGRTFFLSAGPFGYFFPFEFIAFCYVIVFCELYFSVCVCIFLGFDRHCPILLLRPCSYLTFLTSKF